MNTYGGLYRVYFYLYALFTNLIGILVPQAFIFKMIAQVGTWGWVILIVMSLLTVAGLIESIVNDVLPARFSCQYLLSSRHIIVMAIVVCYGALIWFGVEIQSYLVISLYVLQIVFMCLGAFLDVQHRYKAPQKIPEAFHG